MKKPIVLIMILAISLTLCCSCGAPSPDSSSQPARTSLSNDEIEENAELSQQIQDYLDSNCPSEIADMLATSKRWQVFVKEKKATIYARVLFDFYLAPATEGLLPVVSDALNDAGCELEQFQTCIYSEDNNGGVEKGTFIAWKTRNLSTGILASDIGESTAIPFTTVDDIYETYGGESVLAGDENSSEDSSDAS